MKPFVVGRTYQRLRNRDTWIHDSRAVRKSGGVVAPHDDPGRPLLGGALVVVIEVADLYNSPLEFSSIKVLTEHGVVGWVEGTSTAFWDEVG